MGFSQHNEEFSLKPCRHLWYLDIAGYIDAVFIHFLICWSTEGSPALFTTSFCARQAVYQTIPSTLLVRYTAVSRYHEDNVYIYICIYGLMYLYRVIYTLKFNKNKKVIYPSGIYANQTIVTIPRTVFREIASTRIVSQICYVFIILCFSNLLCPLQVFNMSFEMQRILRFSAWDPRISCAFPFNPWPNSQFLCAGCSIFFWPCSGENSRRCQCYHSIS
jgi:hypothetical protein